MSEYVVIKKTLKAGGFVYVEGERISPPYPDDIWTEINTGSDLVERFVEEEPVVEDSPIKKKPVKKRAKK